MKGFLQRLAASATRAEARTHPLVDSIYATPHPTEQSGPSLYSESMDHPTGQQIQANASPAIGTDENLIVRKAQSGVAHPTNSVVNAKAGAPEPIFEPLVQPATGKPFANSLPAAEPLDAMERSSHFSPELPTYSPSIPSTEREIGSRGLESLPIIVERLLRADASSAQESDSSGRNTETNGLQTQPRRKEAEVSTVAAQVNARRQQPYVSPQSRAAQPEEIQIHIGRIEVLAVPQPAPRPATEPARKGLSLDEYLSRRNGRRG